MIVFSKVLLALQAGSDVEEEECYVRSAWVEEEALEEDN
jgi:hypothetical protein